jgi:predicted acyltransferase
MSQADSPNSVPPGQRRLMSLDALRGFDMFWIVGGEGLVLSLAALANGGEPPAWLAGQMEHVPWNGFRFYDLIFPLFVFMVGVALPFSLLKRAEEGQSKWPLYGRIVRRTMLLVLLGLIYNGLLQMDFANLRYPSVLGRIGLAYGFAAMIALHTSARGRWMWIATLLLGYWAAMTWIPVPGIGAGDLAPGKTLADYIDRCVLPGRLYVGNRDPEGLFSTIPAIATVLLGVLAGQWLRPPRRSETAKVLGLLAAAGAALAVGYFWNGWFPINKNLWSSSFVLWTGGWSLMLLALFYLLIDVLGLRRWAFAFVVIGTNAIAIYLASRFIDFEAVGRLLFAHAPVHAVLLDHAGLLVAWLALYVLYRGKLFLRL